MTEIDALAARKHISEATLIAAIRHHGAILSLVARALGSSRQNVHQRVKSSPKLRDLVRDVEDELLDIAEAHIITAVRRGDPSIVRWYMKNKGASRGYGRQSASAASISEQELEGIVVSVGGSIQIFRRLLRSHG